MSWNFVSRKYYFFSFYPFVNSQNSTAIYPSLNGDDDPSSSDCVPKKRG